MEERFLVWAICAEAGSISKDQMPKPIAKAPLSHLRVKETLDNSCSSQNHHYMTKKEWSKKKKGAVGLQGRLDAGMLRTEKIAQIMGKKNADRTLLHITMND